ncbi:general secretion pathway protein GspK [Pseudomarimonas arenosa]|uniref:Type II secretion system protein K n=1 Tax=Pseudomarimonas arenosa TaxID=2774145 RepID=A0AAW3ZMQ7_9GAMM|nr:type II secretion system protein GspK [Pseudomarimonas arenosa]MBD8526449.1 general secretion pathway protein GspK [Pseudomarimonas arenosa]
MSRQSGIALLIVMWLLALLAIVLGAFTVLARSERMQARHLFEGTKAHYAAEAGIHRAVMALAVPDPLQRWIPDGRAYQFQFEGAEVEIEIHDESGKIDLNAVDPAFFSRFLQGMGVDMVEADELAAAVADWRDTDDLLTPGGAEDDDYEALGLSYGAKDAPFDLISELQQVRGVSYDLYSRLAPHLTLYSGLSQPNAAFAPAAVLGALPGMDPNQAAFTVDTRRQYDPNSGLPPLTLTDGTPLVVAAGSGTYNVRSRARLNNGAWAELDAVVRLGGAPSSGLAFTALRWQDGTQL